jgi:Glycosyltransferase family 87
MDTSWNVIAAAALLAAVLHLVIVLFIYRIDRKHQGRFLDKVRPHSHANVVLVVFSAAFLAFAALTGAQGDYNEAYLKEWMAVLDGADPWGGEPFNAYGPLFNLLAPLAWVNPLANKLLFAFSYLVFVIWLTKDFGSRQGFVAVSWPSVGLWLLNPFPWEQIAYCGYFDVLVSLACVAAVHSLVSNKDGVSGAYLALGILLKYMPIVILPFLVFNKRRFHFRLLSFCVGIVVLGLVVSVLIWGTSTFLPIKVAATRESLRSIYVVLASTHSPLRLFFDSPNVDWLEKPLLLTAGLATFTWCMLRRIEPALSSALAILVTLLFYRIGWANYQMVLFSLISYWAVSNWAQFKDRSVLIALLVGYFSFLAVTNLAFWWRLVGSIFYSNIVVSLLQFLLGCALLVTLVRLRPAPCAD